MNQESEKITAAAALSKIAEIKQFDLDEDFSYLAKLESVQSINAAAKAATGIDLLNSNKKLSLDDLEKYENYLERVIDNNLTKKFSEPFLADELSLIRNTTELPLEEYRTLHIAPEKLLPGVKRPFKAVGLNVPSIMPLIKKPIRVQRLNGSEHDLLVLSKAEIKSKPVYVLFYLNIGELNISQSLTSFSTIQNESKKFSGDLDANVIMAFFFQNMDERDAEPLKLFLRAIIKYGKDITIGNETRKLFLEGVSSKLLIQDGDTVYFGDGIIEGSSAKGIKGIAIFSMQETHTGYKYFGLFVISFDRMLADLSAHKYIP